jgi:F-type H+-transporting ATPase subunit b
MDEEAYPGYAAEPAPLDAFFADPTTWAFAGLAIFIGLLLWRRVPAMVTRSLDDRGARIASELAAAEALRQEAEAKLAEVERRQSEAEAEARAIVEAAQREAAQLAAQARRDLDERLARRQKLAEERIARAEQEAVRDVRLAAADAASRAAAALLSEKLDPDAQFAAGLEQVRKALAQPS